MQRALRHHHAPPGQQLAGLDHRQVLIDQPRPQHRRDWPPAPPTPAPCPRGRCGRTFSQITASTASVSCSSPPARSTPHSTAAATYRRTVLRSTVAQPLDRAQPLTAQPQAENLSDLVHTNLPERHRHLRAAASRSMAMTPTATPQPVDPRVVPLLAERWSHPRWRNSPQGGPILVAGDTYRDQGGQHHPFRLVDSIETAGSPVSVG